MLILFLCPQMSQKVVVLEQEIERLSDGAELENVSLLLKTTSHTLRISLKSFSNTSVIKRVYFLQLRSEKQHLESELERAERESAIYVTEVREVRKKPRHVQLL